MKISRMPRSSNGLHQASIAGMSYTGVLDSVATKTSSTKRSSDCHVSVPALDQLLLERGALERAGGDDRDLRPDGQPLVEHLLEPPGQLLGAGLVDALAAFH